MWLRTQLGITTPHIPSMRAVYERLDIGVVWARQDEMSPFVDGASLRAPLRSVQDDVRDVARVALARAKLSA